MPGQDYAVLLGPRRKLADVEVRKIAQDLADQSILNDQPVSVTDIEEMINNAVLQNASAEDVARVSARLAGGGWPLIDPPHDA